jgi:hypothetical protein
MAAPIIRNDSKFGIEVEVTEGTYVAPSGVTSYFQPLEGVDFDPQRELLERAVMNASIGKSSPILGMKDVALSAPVEFRASGTEGAEVDYGLLLKGALGNSRVISGQVTSKNVAHTSTVIEIEDADIGDFTVGDIVVILESTAYEVRPISAIDTTGGAANITLAFALTNGAPSNAVVISKTQMYFTADTGHPSISLSYYWADTIRQAGLGCKVESMALENFATGQLANWNFALKGLNYTHTDGVAPHTPSYDSGVPSPILSSCVYLDGVALSMNNFGLNLANTLSPISSMCNANGKTGQRVSERTITGTLNPYTDDTAFANFTSWNTGTEHTLFAVNYLPEATNGITLGTVVALWMPVIRITEFKVDNQEGLNIDNMSFKATRGTAGGTEELYVATI